MDDTWRNGVLIEKVFNLTISRFNIPEDWTPPPLKSGETKFEEMYNPGKWPQFFYCQSLKNNDYIWHQLTNGAMPVTEDVYDRRCSKNWEFFYKGWEGRDDGDAESSARD